MSKARISEVTAYFNSDIKSVWNVVTNNSNYKWRSDIERVEIINDGKEFIEYSHGGNATKFIITKKNEYSEYEFKMQNTYISDLKKELCEKGVEYEDNQSYR